MKVFVVIRISQGWENSSSTVVGVFDTEEKAEAFADSGVAKFHPFDWFEVESHEVG